MLNNGTLVMLLGRMGCNIILTMKKLVGIIPRNILMKSRVNCMHIAEQSSKSQLQIIKNNVNLFMGLSKKNRFLVAAANPTSLLHLIETLDNWSKKKTSSLTSCNRVEGLLDTTSFPHHFSLSKCKQQIGRAHV